MHIRAGTEPDPEPMVDINTTPLVDVLLVLLVMLIITIPIQLHAVDIEMPGRSTPPPDTPPAVVQLDVAPTGGWLERRATRGPPGAGAAAARSGRPAPQPEIHLRPHPQAKYDTVAATLSSAQRLGLQKIGLVGTEALRP
ncbi:biopolymer transporter ExbD [Ramlibacter terrae]|uniref:Biopolymer transporter ExbD n=1 Tax=Ramlibacter terrae TaxID=2732511 RepID=A0ABX6P049_9BURK|nr:biopolymer transporter ExbD [Ramlibacter terrae]